MPETIEQQADVTHKTKQSLVVAYIQTKKATHLLHFYLSPYIISYVAQGTTTTTKETYMDIRRMFENI